MKSSQFIIFEWQLLKNFNKNRKLNNFAVNQNHIDLGKILVRNIICSNNY